MLGSADGRLLGVTVEEVGKIVRVGDNVELLRGNTLGNEVETEIGHELGFKAVERLGEEVGSNDCITTPGSAEGAPDGSTVKLRSG